MRKIEGLRFLQKFFSNVCVDCVFVTQDELFNLCEFESHDSKIFRVRSGRKIGSELGSPQQTCHSIQEVKCFIEELLKFDKTLEFVVHRVDQQFFEPEFVGTIALFQNVEPMMVVDFQVASKMLVSNMDSGARPRDWKVVATYIYPFLGMKPLVQLSDPSFDPLLISEPLFRLWGIGREIDDIKRSLADEVGTILLESATRFNIYHGGNILLDDHRSIEAFC